MPNVGSDLAALASLSGSIVDQNGQTLISTDSDGEAAVLLGPSVLREVQTGVANGDFAIPPADAVATITADNPLPYWTFTDVNSAGAITCAIASDANAASGNTLRWSIAASTPTGRSARLTRFIPVASTRNRAFAYSPEVNTFAATNTTTITMTMTAQFYEADRVTTTGSTITSGAVTFSTLGTGSNWLTGSYTTANSAPSDAAFCLVTITVATTGAGSPASTSTVDIPEVRLIRGDQTNLFAEYTTPATYAPTLVRQVNGNLQISPNAGTGAVQIGGALNLDTRHTIVSNNTSSILFTRNDTGTRSSLVVKRVFPGDQTTRYMDDDGTYVTFNAGLSLQATTVTTGIFKSNGSGYENDTPTTTTATTNAAIWVIVSGTNYALRRNSSSARYKTNIEDADEAVLEAARKIKPRHYESTIPEEAGATRLGFIAEEVYDTGLTHGVGLDAEGRPETLDSVALIAALFARVNDLEARIVELESR